MMLVLFVGWSAFFLFVLVRFRLGATPVARHEGVQPVWFTPTETGAWEIVCSQLCGLGHYRMRGFYTVQTQAEYDACLAEEAARIATP